MHTISQGVFSAMVSNGVVNPASCGHTAMQAPHLMQAFQLIEKMTGVLLGTI
jgi:hypothetical protein